MEGGNAEPGSGLIARGLQRKKQLKDKLLSPAKDNQCLEAQSLSTSGPSKLDLSASGDQGC